MTRSIVPTESALADCCGKGRPLTLANGRFWHFGDIDPARFNVRFRALFGHQSKARLCRRMTLSGHPHAATRPVTRHQRKRIGPTAGGRARASLGYHSVRNNSRHARFALVRKAINDANHTYILLKSIHFLHVHGCHRLPGTCGSNR